MKKALPAPNARETAEHPAVTEEKIAEYLQTFGMMEKLQPNEIGQFTRIACEFQLNPFKREIYCVAYGSGYNRTCSIIVGYEVYLKRAERTGKLDGWKAWAEGEGENLKAIVEINRKDWQHAFTHEVYWKEAVQKKKEGGLTSFWSRMPKFQLKKVAISQGFRLCFPDDLGGIPYDGAELGIETPYSEQDIDPSYQIIPEKEETNPEPAKDEKAAETPTAITSPAHENKQQIPPKTTARNEPTQASSNGKPAAPSKSSETKAKGDEIITAIGEILNTVDAKGQRYFSEDDKVEARQLVASVKAGEPGLIELRSFKDFLSGELAKRENSRKAA